MMRVSRSGATAETVSAFGGVKAFLDWLRASDQLRRDEEERDEVVAAGGRWTAETAGDLPVVILKKLARGRYREERGDAEGIWQRRRAAIDTQRRVYLHAYAEGQVERVFPGALWRRFAELAAERTRMGPRTQPNPTPEEGNKADALIQELLETHSETRTKSESAVDEVLGTILQFTVAGGGPTPEAQAAWEARHPEEGGTAEAA